MTRKKVKLEYITKDVARKATFKKRSNGLIKKVKELSTLCGIKACAIIYNPFDSTTETWPSESGLPNIISEFKSLPVMDQQKKMVDQETYLKQRIAKETEKLMKQKKMNRVNEMNEILIQCLDGNMNKFPRNNVQDLNDLGFLIEQYHKDVVRRVEILRNSGREIGEASNVVEGTGSMAAITAPQYHQQHHYPDHQDVGIYDQFLNPNYNQEMMMNHPQQMSQIRVPFMDDSQHNHHQQQRIIGESSTAPAAEGAYSDLSNSILFR